MAQNHSPGGNAGTTGTTEFVETVPDIEDTGLVAFVDSSAIVALVNAGDASHGAAAAAYSDLLDQGYKLFTTNHVIAETVDLLAIGLGPDVARRWLRDHRLPVYHADEQDEHRARTLVISSRSPRGLSFIDAVSLVVLERFSVADAFAVDPNFLSETP